MIVRKDAINLVKDNHHSYEQFPALFRVLALAQIVRQQFELRC
jgi:hypothetical protein